MLARKTWYLLAVAMAVFALWLAFQPQSIVYSETERDGVLYVSRIDCGTGFAMVFAGEFDPDIPGAATQADCLRYGRTRVVEVLGLGLITAITAYVGRRYGTEPPRPIRSELPDLPRGAGGVEGRKPRTPES
ncbi:MAG: hypothetical protein WD990_02445 [Acidimicrobiia bacterium]